MGRSKILLGVVGTAGSGKTFFSKVFSEFGATVINADKIGWEILKDSKIKEALQKEFGYSIFSGSNIDRKILGNIVFSDNDKLKLLNSIVHPELIKRLKYKLDSIKKGVVVVDAALILQWKIEKWFNYIVLLKSKKCKQRLVSMGYNEKIVENIINVQRKSLDESKADFIVINDGSMEELKIKAEEIWRRINEIRIPHFN